MIQLPVHMETLRVSTSRSASHTRARKGWDAVWRNTYVHQVRAPCSGAWINFDFPPSLCGRQAVRW